MIRQLPDRSELVRLLYADLLTAYSWGSWCSKVDVDASCCSITPAAGSIST